MGDPICRDRRNEKGVVLIATLTMLLTLFVLVSEVNRRSREELSSMSRTAIASELRATAVSGVQIAMAILAEDGKQGGVDSIQELWADPERLAAFLSELSFGKGELDLSISDELGKIQINALVKYPAAQDFNVDQKGLWDRIFELLNRADEDLDSLGENSDIVNSVKDWLDDGDGDATTGLSGAEDDHYLNLEDPYPCGNGPLRHIDEMARIKGIDMELLNRSEAGFRIKDLLTVYGAEPAGTAPEGSASTDAAKGFQFPGKININTAELPVLFAMMPETLSDIDKKIAAQSIVEYRSDRNESGFLNTLEGEWYNTCPGCENNGIKATMIRTDSTVFSIVAQASTKEDEVAVQCVVTRDGETLTVLSWSEGALPEPPKDESAEGTESLFGGGLFDF